MSFLGFGQSADVTIRLRDVDNRKTVKLKTEEGIGKLKYLVTIENLIKAETRYLYYDGEAVAGTAIVFLKKPGQKLEHQGIRVEFIGQIEIFYDRGNHYNFIHLERDLAPPGELYQTTEFKFEFPNVEKPFESYTGNNVKLRYFIRVTIIRRLTDVVRETDIAVQTLCTYPENCNNIKMEVGIEDCLHIEFEYNKSRYHLRDVIVGKIYFLLVRIKIKHMEIAIIKRETVGMSSPPDTEPIAKYEIMDGAPVRGESIPIRLFLAGYDLTPTLRDVCKRFSVRYYLNLVLVDEEDRRYFKQQEIILWRKAELPPRQPIAVPTKGELPASATKGSDRQPSQPDPAMQRYEGGSNQNGTPDDEPTQKQQQMEREQSAQQEDTRKPVDDNDQD